MVRYSNKFKEEAVRLHKKEGLQIQSVAKLLSVSVRSVSRWVNHGTDNKPRVHTPYKIPNDKLLLDVSLYPDAYLYEHASRLNCSKSGVKDALDRLGITRKKTLIHPNRDEHKRAIFIENIATYKSNGHEIVFLDESGFEKDIPRIYGYSQKGKRCYGSHDWQSKIKENVIGALWNKTIIAAQYFSSYINTERFYNWLNNTLLPKIKR